MFRHIVGIRRVEVEVRRLLPGNRAVVGQSDRTGGKTAPARRVRLGRVGRRVLSAWAAALVLAGLTGGPAAASPSLQFACAGASFTWTGNGDDTSWGDPRNWSPNGDPGACPGDSVDVPI